MYILESIQEFDGRKIGIYTFGKDSTRKRRKALNLILKNEVPPYAILTLEQRITKGQHKLFVNQSSFVAKLNEEDGTQFDSLITI